MLIRSIEKFLREHDMPATKFGRLAAHDPRFVLDLRMGRIPRAATEARTRQWMAEYVAAQTTEKVPALEYKAIPSAFGQPKRAAQLSYPTTFGAALAQEFAHAY